MGRYINLGNASFASVRKGLYYISMNQDGLKDAIVSMLSGVPCKINTRTFQNDMMSINSKDDVLTLLVHLGYLAYDSIKKEVYIPNQEVAVSG